MRCSWDTVFDKTAREFLNVVCYRKDKEAKKKAEIEKYRKSR